MGGNLAVAAVAPGDMTDLIALASNIDEASTAVEEFASENCPDLPTDFLSRESPPTATDAAVTWVHTSWPFAEVNTADRTRTE